MDSVDREIINASKVIDRALAKMNEENRGEEALNMLSVTRNLNDHIALKIWRDIEPAQPMSINKVARKLITRAPYQFIGRFDKFLQKSVSHFTPNEDGAERLSIKYYPYLLDLKKLMHRRYGIEILEKIDRFVPDTDSQTQDYYDKIADVLRNTAAAGGKEEDYDNYYIHRVMPFFSKGKVFYEVTLEPAGERPNKFNRITAFCRGELMSNYCTALGFSEENIDLFGVRFPIKIITGWNVSIRPCELMNFGKLLDLKFDISRGHKEYLNVMTYLTKNRITFLDLIDLDEEDYLKVKDSTIRSTRDNHSHIFDMLDICRKVSIEGRAGKNILRYLLCRMNNRIIKLQFWNGDGNQFCFNLSKDCQPFDEKPISFNPKGHRANLDDVLESLQEFDIPSFLAKIIDINTNQGYQLYTPVAELKNFGDDTKIRALAESYNSSLYEKFRPDCEIGFLSQYAFLKGEESRLVEIIEKLKGLRKNDSLIEDCFLPECVDALKDPENNTPYLNDKDKEKILCNMYANSRVRFVYGAAGTGKTTMINFVAKLVSGKRKLFLAKTNPAVENLKHRVTNRQERDVFVTVDRFLRGSNYTYAEFDLIVVDECSTVTNYEINKIIDRLGRGSLLLVGDMYQIQAIGFGNWFYLAKALMPDDCCGELQSPYRSSDAELKALWKEVREIKKDNLVLEELVRNEYSHPIDNSIFDKKADDEIILCLNYNGLYGLNNINRLLQLGNRNRAVAINVWQFKEGDPILFNDCERFPILYNNLKGRIVGIEDCNDYVRFRIRVAASFQEEEVERYGLTFEEGTETETVVSFNVSRRPPFSSDLEADTVEHILPFEVAYAVSIHKSQGLEYDSVKIVISDETEDRITHSVFYTAITRAKSHLSIYWSPEVCNHIIKRMQHPDYCRDQMLLKEKYGM